MINQKTIDDIKVKHPLDDLRKATITTAALDEAVELIVRVPQHVVWTKYIAALRDEKKSVRATRDFVFDSVLYPPADELNELFSRQPGLVNRIAERLGDLAGVQAKVETEKL